MPISKETILNEIRRLAKTNGGVAPGRLALETEAGIRETDWRGVYWAKYNDAVKEAGLEPNKMAKAYSKEHLLEIPARLTKRLGHVPTYSELRLETRSQPGIPAEKVFAHLGSKTEQMVQLLTFSRDHQDYADVVAICEAALASLPKDNTDEAVATDSDGFVYLIKSGRHYKIGCTKGTDQRMSALAYQTVERNVRIHTIRTDDPYGIEKYWHARFAEKRVRSDAEWFALNAKDVAAFKRRKKFM